MEYCTTYLCTLSLFFGCQDCQGEKGVQFSLWRENPDENPDFRIFFSDLHIVPLNFLWGYNVCHVMVQCASFGGTMCHLGVQCVINPKKCEMWACSPRVIEKKVNSRHQRSQAVGGRRRSRRAGPTGLQKLLITSKFMSQKSARKLFRPARNVIMNAMQLLCTSKVYTRMTCSYLH